MADRVPFAPTPIDKPLGQLWWPDMNAWGQQFRSQMTPDQFSQMEALRPMPGVTPQDLYQRAQEFWTAGDEAPRRLLVDPSALRLTRPNAPPYSPDDNFIQNTNASLGVQSPIDTAIAPTTTDTNEPTRTPITPTSTSPAMLTTSGSTGSTDMLAAGPKRRSIDRTFA